MLWTLFHCSRFTTEKRNLKQAENIVAAQAFLHNPRNAGTIAEGRKKENNNKEQKDRRFKTIPFPHEIISELWSRGAGAGGF